MRRDEYREISSRGRAKIIAGRQGRIWRFVAPRVASVCRPFREISSMF